MRSGKPTPCVPHPTLLSVSDTLPVYQRATNRWTNCLAIARWAGATGWRVTPETVNRYYTKYALWYVGQYATGYMVRNHGLRRKAR